MSAPTVSSGWVQSPGWGLVDRPTHGEHGGCLFVAPLSTGAITVLEGTAAVVARAALAGGGLSTVHSAVAQALGVDRDSIDEEVLREVLGELVRLGLLRDA